jgi:hypothetical protein
MNEWHLIKRFGQAFGLCLTRPPVMPKTRHNPDKKHRDNLIVKCHSFMNL